MKQFAWYSPEFDVIVLQRFDCPDFICFEWGNADFCDLYDRFGCTDPLSMTLWFPLGEI